jgi:hypothetical protein
MPLSCAKQQLREQQCLCTIPSIKQVKHTCKGTTCATYDHVQNLLARHHNVADGDEPETEGYETQSNLQTCFGPKRRVAFYSPRKDGWLARSTLCGHSAKLLTHAD